MKKYVLNWLNISQKTPGSTIFFFSSWQALEIKSSEMCPWLLRGDGDPGHTWNKAKANLIMMSLIQRCRGDIGYPPNINGGTQN